MINILQEFIDSAFNLCVSTFQRSVFEVQDREKSPRTKRRNRRPSTIDVQRSSYERHEAIAQRLAILRDNIKGKITFLSYH